MHLPICARLTLSAISSIIRWNQDNKNPPEINRGDIALKGGGSYESDFKIALEMPPKQVACT